VPPLGEGDMERAFDAEGGGAGGGAADGVGGPGTVLVLDRPLSLERDAPVPPELCPGGSAEVWLMLLCYSAGHNLDMQERPYARSTCTRSRVGGVRVGG
jgi:hypothetical protein